MIKKDFAVEIIVNGTSKKGLVEGRTLLVDFLRENAGEKSVKIGCEEGACGACTVKIDGKIAKSCLLLAANCHQSVVSTVTSQRDENKLSDLQQSFIDSHALQCGYCTSGMIMSAQDFLDENGDRDFTEDDIKQALA